MPTVPTYSDLPTVQDARPEVTPQKPISGFQIRRLGAVGQGEEALGQGLDKASADAGRIGDVEANQQNEVAQKNAAVQHQTNVNNLGYVDLGTTPGTPDGGYYSMKGQAAVNARPAYLAAVAASQTASGQGLSQNAQVGYNAQTQQDMVRENAKALNWGMIQGQDAAVQSSAARSSLAQTTAALNYNNPDEVAKQLATVHGEASEQARIRGWDPNGPQTTAYENGEKSKLFAGMIDRAMANNDPRGANAILTANGGSMDPAASLRAQDQVKGPLLQLDAHDAAAGIAVRHGYASQGSGNSNTGPIAATDLPPEAAKFLPALSGGEGNYSSPAPKGDQSGKGWGNNRYQFLNSSWEAQAPGAGVDVNDKSNGAQDKVAWNYAANTYNSKTGGDLAADIRAGGNEAKIASALNKVWPSLPGGSEQNTTQAQFEARMGGSTQAAGPGAPVQTLPDWGAMHGDIPPDPPGRPGLSEAIARNINQMEASYTNAHAVQKEDLDRNVLPKTLDAIKAGAVDTYWPTSIINQVHNPAEQAQLEDQRTKAVTEGNIALSTQYATPPALAAQRAPLLAAVTNATAHTNPDGSVTPPTAPLSADEMTKATEKLAAFDRVTAHNATLMHVDPAQYVRNQPTIAPLWAAANANPNDPAAQAKAIKQSEVMQAQLGATPEALPRATLDGIVAGIHAAPAEGVPKMMADLRTKYGDAWNDVYRDLSDPTKGKLDPRYGVFATMTQTGAAPTDYAAALKAQSDKGEKFGEGVKNIAGGGGALQMDTEINGAMTTFQGSFRPGEGSALIAGQRDAVRMQATNYIDTGKYTDIRTAVKNAYNNIVGDNVDIDRGGLRVPKTLPNGVPMSAALVRTATDKVEAGLTEADLRPGITLAEARGGTWRTNPDGLTATLYAVKGPNWVPVQHSDLRPVTIDFRQLNQTP